MLLNLSILLKKNLRVYRENRLTSSEFHYVSTDGQFQTPITANQYSTEYSYDPRGNIESLKRNGLVSMNNGVPVFGEIDNESL